VLVFPHGAIFEFAGRLEFACTNNQTEYEAFLHGLDYLQDMGVKSIKAFGDSMLVVQ
jgi:ribonuclease HI